MSSDDKPKSIDLVDKVKELEQENVLLKKINDKLEKNNEELEKELKELKEQVSSKAQADKESAQEQQILKRISELQAKKSETLGTEKERLEQTVETKTKQLDESKDEREVLKQEVKVATATERKMTRKYYLAIALSAVVIGVVVTGYSLFVVDYVLGEEYQIKDLGEMKSSYIIQNLKGVYINTWLSWRITEGNLIYINIVNGEEYPEKAELIKDTILSNEKIQVDKKLLNPESEGTMTYYLGWAGALEKSSQFPTELYIPKNIEVISNTNGAGEIIIRLEDKSHGDGISGSTESIADQGQHQILKSTITIYDVEDISDNQLQAVARHELGHAFGLSHSSDPDDLMYTTLKTGFPYVSECDVRALALLYDGSQQSKVVCIKLGE